jgi:hypothetical protein
MKKIITNLVVLLLFIFHFSFFTTYAQSPKMFKYQTVVRNSTGFIIQNQAVAFKISILQGSTTGNAIYSETQSKITNDFGLVNLEIGNGAIVTGTINTINWANGPYFAKVELDINNGTNFITMGTSELLSVPYALYAEKAGTASYNETDPIFSAHPSFGITTTNITNWTTAFGWGNHSGLYRPISYVPDWGEITGKPSFATVATSGNYSDLSGKPTLFSGAYADLTGKPALWDSSWSSIKNKPSFFDGSWANLTGKPNFSTVATTGNYNDLSNKPTLISTFTNDAGYLTTETQTLGLVNDTLSISGTNKVSLQNYKSKWLNNGNNIYYNDGKVGINAYSIDARLKVEEFLNTDTAIAIYAHTMGGIAVKGKSIATSSMSWMNNGIKGEVEANNNFSGRAIYGQAYGTGNGVGVFGESYTDKSNYGVRGFALSKTGNIDFQIGGYFEARGDWNIGNGIGNGLHYGVYSSANGNGINYGIFSSTYSKSGNAYEQFAGRFYASGSAGATGNLYGVYATADGNGYWNVGGKFDSYGNLDTASNFGVEAYAYNNVKNYGYNQAVFAEADSSTYVNRGMYAGVSSAVGQHNQAVLGRSDGVGNPNVSYSYNIGLYGYATNNRKYNYGVRGFAEGGTNPGSFNEGVYGYVQGTKGESIGVDGTNASQGKNNIGVGGYAYGAVTADSINIGMYSYVANADTNYAMFADAQYNGKVNYGIYAVAKNGITNNYAGFFDGNVTVRGNLNVTGNISKASGTFKIDHPLDPQNKYLVHSFVESPDMLNVYSGNIVTDNYGLATVILPDYFSAANTDFRYQLCCIGQFAQVIVKDEIASNQFVIQSDKPNVKISWQVTGVRNDNYAQKNKIIPVQEKPEIEKGTYLHPEAYGKTEKEGTYKTHTSPPKKPDMHLSEKERAERMRESISNPSNPFVK